MLRRAVAGKSTVIRWRRRCSRKVPNSTLTQVKRTFVSMNRLLRVILTGIGCGTGGRTLGRRRWQTFASLGRQKLNGQTSDAWGILPSAARWSALAGLEREVMDSGRLQLNINS